MKLVYMYCTWYICTAQGLKMGAREPPLTENAGLSEWPLTGKTGVFGAKNNRNFSICPGRKSRTKNCTFFKRGSFGAAQVEKVESSGAVKAGKWGWRLSRGTLLYCPYMRVPHSPPPSPS